MKGFWDLKGLEGKGVILLSLFVSKRSLATHVKDIEDEKFQEVIDYINFLKQNPT